MGRRLGGRRFGAVVVVTLALGGAGVVAAQQAPAKQPAGPAKQVPAKRPPAKQGPGKAPAKQGAPAQARPEPAKQARPEPEKQTAMGLARIGPAPAALRPVISDLASSDIGKVRHAIGELESSTNPFAATALAAFVRGGPPGPALVPALNALAKQRTAPVDLFIQMSRHRRADARVAAAEALSNHRMLRVANVLEGLLSDPVADVRGAAAAALATAGSRSNVPVLFRALERNIDEAALGIGKLGSAEEVGRLAALLGRRPLEALLPGIEAAILRTDLSAQARIDVVRKLGALQTPEVKEFLERVQLAVPSAPVREAMSAEAGRIAG